MTLLITNGNLVTDSGTIRADILCEGESIAAILEPNASCVADEVMDVEGAYVFPGFIDPHVHSRDPGDTHKETFNHSTLGALCGGITTILEMPNAVPPVADVETFHARKEHHEKSAWVDFGLWGLALGPENNDQIPGLFEAGAVGVKLFWGYALDKKTKALVYNFTNADPDSIFLPPENGEVLELFRLVASVGGLLAAHCEDRHILASSAAALGRGIQTYDDLLSARPAIAEATTIATGAQFSRETGCRFHVVHMASAAGLQVVREAQAAGISISAETCPQYLTLTAENEKELGPLIKVYPPVRYKEDQEALWDGLIDGSISFVGSDHAPHPVEEKMVGFADAPAGGLGVETIAPLMVDAFARGRLTAQQLSSVMSQAAAKTFGLYPQKGSLLVGTHADFTIVNRKDTRVIRNEEMHALNPVSAWDGWELKGRIVASVIRGRVSMRNNEPVGDRHGKFIAAQHSPQTKLQRSHDSTI